MKNNFKAAAMLLAFVTLFFLPVDAATRLTILHTNDTHSRMLPFDSKQHGPDCGGIVRRSGLIEHIRSQEGEILLLDAGDILQGTPFYSIFKGEACYRTAKACGYDATTLGNHELDNDLGNLQARLAETGMRLLCCNVFFAGTRRPVFAPYHVFVRNGLKIGVIGSIGNEAWEDIDRKIRAPMALQDQTEAVRITARRIRPYVDLVILLSHAGIEFDEQIAAAVAEIDLLIGGHTHVELNQPKLVANKAEAGTCNNGLNGTLVAQAGEWGHFVGRIDLLIEDDRRIASWSGSLIKVSPQFEHLAPAGLVKMVSDYDQTLQKIMNEVLGQAPADLNFPKDERKKALLPMGSFIAAGMRDAAGSDICIVNSGAIRTDLKAGELTRGEIYEAVPYDNTVVTFAMSGAAVQKMLDFVAANFGDPDGYQFAGVTGVLDRKNGRAENIMIGGEPLSPARTYRVSTSSFMANGNIAGDKLFADPQKIEDSGVFMRDAVEGLLKKLGTLPDYRELPFKLQG